MLLTSAAAAAAGVRLLLLLLLLLLTDRNVSAVSVHVRGLTLQICAMKALQIHL